MINFCVPSIGDAFRVFLPQRVAQHRPATRDLRRAADKWDSPHFTGIFLASGLYSSQALSRPAPNSSQGTPRRERAGQAASHRTLVPPQPQHQPRQPERGQEHQSHCHFKWQAFDANHDAQPRQTKA